MLKISIDQPGVLSAFSHKRNKNIHYFGYPCPTKTSCAPFKVEFPFDTIAYVELWGAKGGSANSQVKTPGGNGGYVSGKHLFKHKTPYYLYIGAMGEPSGAATFGGGGKGTLRSGDGGYGGGSGGGATDIRMIKGDSEEALKSRIIVAAGGAGSETYAISVPGGFGGGFYGGNATKRISQGSTYSVPGVGATPYMGGLSHSGKRSALGYATNDFEYYGSSGGGGFYAGGSGGSDSCVVFSGGGGSSFISGVSIWNTIYYLGRSYRFFNGRTIPGNGSVPSRLDIKNDPNALDGFLKLTIINQLCTSKMYTNIMLPFLLVFLIIYK